MNQKLPVHMSTENPERGVERLQKAWEKAEHGKATGVYLNFEDLAMLLAVMTPKRLELLRTLRQQGPMSVRALAKTLSRDYKNVHADVRALETAGLIERTMDGALNAPWDGIEAHLSLVA